MGYFTEMLIEAKERYGHILKERGLVMRGERADGDLNLVFRSKDGAWRLPVEILVPGKEQTGKTRAGWEDVVLTAQIYSKVKIGNTDWVGFVERQSETLEFLDGDEMSDFVSGIGGFLKETVLINNVRLEHEVASEVAAACFELTENKGVQSDEIEFKVEGGVQTLTAHDAAGQAISFVWTEKGTTGELLVDGRPVKKIRAFEYSKIENAIADHFEMRSARKFK